MDDMDTPAVYFTALDPETQGDEQMERISADVQLFQKKHNFGYRATIRVWIPRRDAPLSELKNDALREAKEFLEAGLKILSE